MENIKCSVTRCVTPASVLVRRVRPLTTATRGASFVCWTGTLEMVRCALHACDEVTVGIGTDWRFYGDTITFSPLAS